MIDERPRPFATLQRFAQRATQATAAAQERCDLCSEPVPPGHRHLLTVATREMQCVCRACAVLFGNAAASEGKYRLVPDRRLALADFALSAAQWESLRVPVGIAFFFYSTPAGRVVAYYPSPMGPVESLLRLDTWEELAARNPVLRQMEPDVEALLVNRARGASQHYLVPIDECYSLVGLIRRYWRGLGGGQAVWAEIGRFFETLQARARPVAPADKERANGSDG
ncbi:MAG TPA: DUF5947 family protein [Chloroflexota bacterium]|nr:DUF5947 family protein [Chloroflexota bacterium]